jgi:arginyl-tRNA synthetase
MEKQYLLKIFIDALSVISPDSVNLLAFDIPKNPEHGDLSCNIAMQLARILKKSPREIAENITSKLEYDSDKIEKVEIAGAGFINIKFTKGFYTDLFEKIRLIGNDFGRSNSGKGLRVNIEYVSANPTGMLHLGHGRNAVIGDSVSNLYAWAGYEVTREYYFNNAGNQMNNLGKSVYARYMQISNPKHPFPEDGYHGDYIKLIAEDIFNKNSGKFQSGSDSDMEFMRKAGENWCFENINTTLKKMNITQDEFYNEDFLYTSGKIDDLLIEFKTKNISYEKDGAVWMKLTELGLENDRVIVKSSGEPTYRLPDMAYHIEKFKRGYDLIVDVFGADHIATIPDVLAAVDFMGYDRKKVKVLIYQFVTLSENGEQVKMSKRTGKSYTLDELLDELGGDVVRFFLLNRSISTHLEFDLSLAKEQSDKNPVFYLQYAHARICSVFDKAKEKDFLINDECKYNLLTHDNEISLIKQLLRFPNVLDVAREKHEAHIVADYLRTCATAYHKFYHDCRILTDDSELTNARLHLAKMTKNVIANGLNILGISAPERM